MAKNSGKIKWDKVISPDWRNFYDDWNENVQIGRNYQEPKGQIISSIDPYGEENWDDDGQNIPPNLLPLSMKVAAQTIGLDLVAVKPMSAPTGHLFYLDFKYDDWGEESKEPKGQIFSDIDPYGEENWDI